MGCMWARRESAEVTDYTPLQVPEWWAAGVTDYTPLQVPEWWVAGVVTTRDRSGNTYVRKIELAMPVKPMASHMGGGGSKLHLSVCRRG